ncbi:hypothetical protein CBL_12872 [Carabus blaptoides fortunei]
MALRIGFKIHRYLGQNKLKFLLNEQTRSCSSKPKYVIHPVRRLKSSSHTTFVPRKYANTKPMAVSYRDRDLQVNEYEMNGFENDLQPAAMPEYFTSTLESNLANFPEKSDLVRGRFAKSSTQSALTVPLKLPRLANPFPERLKSFPSDTMADDEKAKLMEDEMKMVAQYNLQQSQEAAAYDHHQQLEHSYQSPAALQYHEDDIHQLQPPAAAEDDVEDTLMQSRRPQARPRRAARYFKSSRHIHQPQQQRRFSTVCGLSDLEQCDVILDRLRAQYPEYRTTLKKPLFVPGSREEREFIETTLRCIAKHKQDDADAVVKRAAAPFPSYSEVKTFVREPRMRDLKVSSATLSTEQSVMLTRSYSTTSQRVLSETRPDADHCLKELVTQAQALDATGTDQQQHQVSTWSRRRFSTRPNIPMKSAGCAETNPNKCEYVYEKTTCKKLEAPYPSYSECMGDQYEDEPSECKICPWKIPSPHARKTSADDSSGGKKKYSTFTAAAADAGPEKLAHKKKPACKNPFTDKKPCDFERAAEKQDEKRRKRPIQPSPKSQPASKKSFSTLTTMTKSTHAFHTFSNSRLHAKKPAFSSSFSTQSLTDNKTIVNRIRRWLNSWRPGSDNIRITQSADVSAGRETYIIEIQDIEAEQRPETAAPWISSESLRPATAHHVSPTAGYACAESSGKKPGKDVGKDKSKKDALNYTSIQINDDHHEPTTTSCSDPLSQKTQEINALKEPKAPGQFENCNKHGVSVECSERYKTSKLMYNTKNIHGHNGRIPDTPILHSTDDFTGCNLNSGTAPTSVKPAPPKQSTTSVLRQWRRPDTVDSGLKQVATTKYAKVDNSGYPATLDNPAAEYSMYNQQQHSTAVPANRPYLSHVQYGDSGGYNRTSPVQPPKQDARVPDSVVKYGSTAQYYAQDEVHFRGGSYPGQSTPPLAHAANAKVTPGYAEGHTYASVNQKLSPNFHYPMVSPSYHQKMQQHDSKSTSQGISEEQNSYCLKSGTYPIQNRASQHGLAPNGHPNVAYSLQNQLDRRQSPQDSSQPYYVNKSACLSQDLRHGRQSYVADKPGGYSQAYAQSYLAQKPSAQEQKSRDYRQIVQSPTKKSPPFPILEQRLSAEGSYYPEYGAGAYAHHKYGPVMLPGSSQKSYLNTSGPKFPAEDIIPSSYAKYYSQNRVAYEPNHYLLQMNQMQTRLNHPNLFSRSTEVPRDVAYMDQTARALQKSRVQYNAIEASQYGAKSSNVGIQKPTKIVSYSSLQDQRLAEQPSGEYFRNYSKPQSVIQSSKMIMDSYNMQGRTETIHEPRSYAYSPPLIHQGNKPAQAQYPMNYRPSAKANDVNSGNISPRRTFQENMPVMVIPPQCIGLPKVSPPQYSLPGQEYPQMYQNYLPKESYYPGSNVKPGNVQYRNDQPLKQPVHVTRNIQVQAARVLPTYPGSQYQSSSSDGPEKILYPARSVYSQQVVQSANPSYSGSYCGPDYRSYEAASVVRSAYAKKEVDIGKSLKEYLESWEDDEDIVTNLPDVVLCNNIPAEKQKHVSFAEPISEAKTISSAEKLPEDETTSQPLYILDSTNISSEALSQYLHIQQIDHLPANIKGYYKLPGVGVSADQLEKPSRAAADQKLQKSKDKDLKTGETRAELHTRHLDGLGRVAESAESPAGKPETQRVTSELVKMDPKSMICARHYSKTRELNILEVTELRIPEISTELAENAAESTSPQDYSVNKRGAAETSEASRFQNCLPQDFSIARKSDAETMFQGAEKLSEVTVESIPQDYSINKASVSERILLAEAASENTTEGSVIHPKTPEDYSNSLQGDVALNLTTNRAKFEDNSEDSHLLREILREADSSIIEDSTKLLSASKLQSILQGGNEEYLERARVHGEDKVSSSNLRNLHPELYANKFSSQLHVDEASSVEATAVIEEYMEIRQVHTASVIVQNTFFDDKSSSRSLLESFVPPSTPKVVQNSHQELESDGSCPESDSPSPQAGKLSINLRPDPQEQLTNHVSFNRDDPNEETVAQRCSENIITIAEDEPSTYTSVESSEMSPMLSDTPTSATLQCNSQSFDSFSPDKSCYEASDQSDLEKEVKVYRKKSLLGDYKQKLAENNSGQSSSDCSDDEERYIRQRTANKDESKERNHDRCLAAIESSDCEDRELFTSDNSDEDKERAGDSATEDVTSKDSAEASTSNYRRIMSSRNEETIEEELDQRTKEEQNIDGEGTADNQSTIVQDETSQSTTTEEDTDDPAQSTSGQNETSQSTIEEECVIEESSTIAGEKDCQESNRGQITSRYEELGDNIQESTVKLDELGESTTGEDGTVSGDDSQGTTDEESTIIQDKESQEAKEIGTTEPVLHQSTDEFVLDKESVSTSHNQAVLEVAVVENAKESLKDQENRHNSSALHQETATDNIDMDEDCKNFACSNSSPESSQQCNKVAPSNNSSHPVEAPAVCQCKKLATCNNAQASVQEHSAASQQCNKIVTSNNAQETVEENSGEYVVLDQDEIIELDTTSSDNQEDISTVDNHLMRGDGREANSSSQSCSEDGVQCEDTASECADIKDCNDLEQSVLHCEESCVPGNSTCISEERNLQTNTGEYEDTALQSQGTMLVIDKEEIPQCEDTSFQCVVEDIRRRTGQDCETTLQFEDTEFNSVLHSEDEDTLRSLEELRDVSLQSEDDNTLLQTSTKVIFEDLTENVNLPAEENVLELKKHMSLLNSEDNSCAANKSALSDRNTSSSKSEDFLIENLISIDEDTVPTDFFEREMESIFKNIPKDPIVPVNVPETYHSDIPCLETVTTIKNRLQPETTARSTDNLKLPKFKLTDPEVDLSSDHSRRTTMVANITETCRRSVTSFEEHSPVETLALSQDDLASKELSAADDEMPEDLAETSIATEPEVTVSGDVLPLAECLVIFSDADDFVILQEPEGVLAETIVMEDERITGDVEELVDEQLDTEPEQPQPGAVVEQMVGGSVEHVQELVATLMPSMADAVDELVVIPADQVIDNYRADPLDKELNKHSEVLIEKQGVANIQTKLTVQDESQEESENQIEIPVNDSVKTEDLRAAELTYEEMQVTMPADDVKSEQDDEELHLVSEIEVVEHFLQDVKYEIKEESPTEQELEMEGIGTSEEFKIDVKEEIVSLEICTEDVQVEDEKVEEFNGNVLHYKMKVEQPLSKEDGAGANVKDKRSEELVEKDLRAADTVSDEKMEDKNDKEDNIKEELEEGELSDQSEPVKTDHSVMDDWDEPEELTGTIQLPVPISEEKKLLFARRKKNLEILKAKLLSAKLIQPDSKASPIHTPAVKIPEEFVQPLKTTFQESPSKVRSPEIPKSESNNRRGSRCASADVTNKSDIVESASEDAFQLPPVFKRFHGSVEDKELFINPENPRYQSTTVCSLESLASRKRSVSYTNDSSLKIEFTAPKRRYSAMEVTRPVRKPIINLDEISQNISQVLERLDSTDKPREEPYNQGTESKETSESVGRARNESHSKEKLLDQENIKVHEKDKHTNISHRNKPPNDNQGIKKLDQFKVFEKMTQRKTPKVLPVNLYDGEECVLKDITGSRRFGEDTTTITALGDSLSQQEPNMSIQNDQTLSERNISTPSLLEDHKTISSDDRYKEASAGQVASAHHMPKPQHSSTLAGVQPSTQGITSSRQSIESARAVTTMEKLPVESPECVVSSHQLTADSAAGRYDPLADGPSTRVDPVVALPKVPYDPRTKKIWSVQNGQLKQHVKLAASTKLCKSTSQSGKSPERRPDNAASKENSQNKREMKFEETKEDKSNVPQTEEADKTVKNHFEMTASQKGDQPNVLGNKEASTLKQKGRNEDYPAKKKGNAGRQKVESSNQKVEANREDSQVTDEDCSIKLAGRKEDEAKIQGTKDDGQRSEEEYQKTNDDKQMKIKGGASSLQCDKNNSDIVRSGDNTVRDNVLKTLTTVVSVDASTVKSSTTLGNKLSSTLRTSPHKQEDSTDLLTSSSSNEDLLSNTLTDSSNVSTGSMNIKSSSSNIKIEQPKPQICSSPAKPERQGTCINVKSMKSGKLNAIIAKLGSANLQGGALKAQISYSANVTDSSASESSASTAYRSFESSQASEDQISSVNQRRSSVDLQHSLAGSKAATLDRLVAPEGLTSKGDEPNIPSAGRDSSKVLPVSGKLDNVPPSSVAASSSNTTSFSVIVEPTASKRKGNDPRSDTLQTVVKISESIENKLSNTFRLTEYTKSYIKLKMNQEMDTNVVNGRKQSDPRLSHKPSTNCSQQLKRKLPNQSEKDTTVTAGLDKRVKINLQDYRNRKQRTVSHENNADDCSSSFDDCLGEVVNGIDDYMTVIEANKQYSIADNVGNSSNSDLTRKSSNLGIAMTDLEIYMDDSMELIPGNEEIVHTSKEEDVLSECEENSGREELDTGNESNCSQDAVKTNPRHRSTVGAGKMRMRMMCKPDSAINQARFEDVSYPGPSQVVQEDDDQDRNEKIILPKTAMVKLTKETIPTNTNHTEPNATNTVTRRRMKSKGEVKMYRPKRRKKRFRNLYATDEDEEIEVHRNAPEMLPNDLTTVRRGEETVASSEAIQDSSVPACATPEDYAHLVSIEPAPCRYRTGTKKHVRRAEESQVTNCAPLDDLPPLSKRQGYQHRPHKRRKSKDGDNLPSGSSEAFSGKLEYKCHINLNALGNKCNMLACDPVQPSTSKVGLKLTLKSVRKEKPAFSEVLGCLDASPTGNTCRRSKHGKRKVPRKEHSAYSVSTSAASRGWTVNDKVPKVIIKRNGSGYCAMSRDVSSNPIWQPVIRVRRHRYIESLVRQSEEDSVP